MVCAMVFAVGLSHCAVTFFDDVSNRGSARSRGLHGLVKEDVDTAAASIGSDVPGSIARLTSSWAEVYIQMTPALYLGGVFHELTQLLFETAGHVPLLWVCLEPFGSLLYAMTTTPLSLKVHMPFLQVVD